MKKENVTLLSKPPGKQAFTLVELIIVITILAILATIAFISFKNYSGNARDGNRLTTVKNLQNGLDLFQVKVGNYPFPDGDNILTGIINNQELTYKGEIGSTIVSQINFSKVPTDPEDSNQKYIYGITSTKQEYQIGITLENPVGYTPYLITPAYADVDTYTAKVEGNYRGYILFFSGSTWIANVPSLIYNFTGTLNGNGVDLLNQAQTYYSINNGNNLPYKIKTARNLTQEDINQVIKNKTGNSQAGLIVISKDELVTYLESKDENPSLPSGVTSTGQLLSSFGTNTTDNLKTIITGKTVSPQTPPTNPVIPPNSTDGVCGTASGKSYSSTTTNFGADTMCSIGTSNPSTPSFPSTGGSTSWSCLGSNGGADVSCSASRSAAIVNGVCGTANAKTYTYTDSSFGSDTLCVSGNSDPSMPSFPTPGNTREWICLGSNGGVDVNCSASRSAAIVNGSCGTASGKSYDSTVTSFGSDTICATGTSTPLNPSFPATGGSTNWSCSGSNGGTTASCSASRKNSGMGQPN